jgi:antitoxin VapB
MTLHIKDPKADKLARELAKVTGESLTEAVTNALEEQLKRKKRMTKAAKEARHARIMEMLAEIDKLPVYDDRTPDEIIGYDENGLPT